MEFRFECATFFFSFFLTIFYFIHHKYNKITTQNNDIYGSIAKSSTQLLLAFNYQLIMYI